MFYHIYLYYFLFILIVCRCLFLLIFLHLLCYFSVFNCAMFTAPVESFSFLDYFFWFFCVILFLLSILTAASFRFNVIFFDISFISLLYLNSCWYHGVLFVPDCFFKLIYDDDYAVYLYIVSSWSQMVFLQKIRRGGEWIIVIAEYHW